MLFNKITVEITRQGVTEKFMDGEKTAIKITAFLDSHGNPVTYISVNDEQFEELSKDEQQLFIDSLHIENHLDMFEALCKINFPKE
ncbi:hypothetical protein [Megasphaera elsdenii]|uniref:hypothetical protein n=1 Tax=Megasphaera elsdenii TaxID=907 RepID=UPI00242F326D|nr:hypothetical protein [Megasphaera elsdenii]